MFGGNLSDNWVFYDVGPSVSFERKHCVNEMMFFFRVYVSADRNETSGVACVRIVSQGMSALSLSVSIVASVSVFFAGSISILRRIFTKRDPHNRRSRRFVPRMLCEMRTVALFCALGHQISGFSENALVRLLRRLVHSLNTLKLRNHLSSITISI